jgi:hypothetical protein
MLPDHANRYVFFHYDGQKDRLECWDNGYLAGWLRGVAIDSGWREFKRRMTEDVDVGPSGWRRED